MIKRKKVGYGIFIVFAVLIFGGCERLERIDNKLGEMFFEDKASSTDSLLDKIKDIKIATTSKESATGTSTHDRVKEITAKDLTREQKERIEEWLAEQGLNRYGDEEGIYYERGTPLIDEDGNTVERFEYILLNRPEVLKEL